MNKLQSVVNVDQRAGGPQQKRRMLEYEKKSQYLKNDQGDNQAAKIWKLF